jgi:hypothetical protein
MDHHSSTDSATVRDWVQATKTFRVLAFTPGEDVSSQTVTSHRAIFDRGERWKRMDLEKMTEFLAHDREFIDQFGNTLSDGAAVQVADKAEALILQKASMAQSKTQRRANIKHAAKILRRVGKDAKQLRRNPDARVQATWCLVVKARLLTSYLDPDAFETRQPTSERPLRSTAP